MSMMLPSSCLAESELPEEFVDVAKEIHSIEVDLRYVTKNNFLGRPVDGYEKSRCVLTREAAIALKQVQDELRPYRLGLKVFDAYRPQRAVDHFVRWSRDASDQQTKEKYYPEVAKGDLFRQGYIATRSGHSRGSTVDLTIVSLGKGDARKELDMGTPFDFFGRESWIDNTKLTPQQRANRLLLREIMTKHGFRPYDKEWWHFTLQDEPYPETYFDFPIR
ncbi:MAG: M15 family metallopeptidase [Lacipirellulaceae bacterium]